MKHFLDRNKLFIACFVFVIAFWAIRITAVNYGGYEYGNVTKTNSYNSDAVAQQNILKDWQAGNRAKVVVGDDNWFIKYPLYVVDNNLPISPIGQLITITIVFLSATALLILYSLDKFIKIFTKDKKIQKRSLIMMSMFLAAIPPEAFHTLAIPNSRNIEIGLTLFLFLQLYRFIFDKDWLKTHLKPKLFLLFILLSCLMANDPLFVYVVVAPTAIFTFAYFIFNKLKSDYFWKLAVFILASFIGSFLIKLLITALFPLSFVDHQSTIVSLAQVESNVNLFLSSGSDIFGVNIWGGKLVSSVTFIRLAYLFILGLSGCFMVSKYKKTKNIFYGLVGFTFLWNILIFLTSSLVSNITSDRYLIYALPMEMLGLLFVVVSIKNVRQYLTVFALLLFTLVLSFGMAAQAIHKDRQTPTNLVDSQVLRALEQNHLTMGYSVYWISGIQTFLSNNKIHELSINCGETNGVMNLSISNLLSEDQTYFTQHPSKTFIVYSPVYKSVSCDASQLAGLLGQPAKELRFGGPDGDYLYIYNYNIASKITVAVLK